MKTTKKISLISVLIILLGCVNIARADVCFLPDGASCAKGDTEGFWPCVGDDCPSPDGKCDASYNSNKSTNECGAACTRCTDSTSPYNGLYKCPENTCNCNEYTSIEAFNECGESCKVCRIAGDKNYGKYKCPAVPEWGCNPQCEDYTLTVEDQCKDCDQCTNKNAPAEKKGLWKCTECDRNIYTQPIAELTSAEIVNHCYENETCGCYMKCDSCFGKEFTMQDCQNAGYDSAKNECNGKRGTVYEACCNTCDGYIFPTDLSKTSEGWSCTPCPNSCDGGSKYSCGCKEGYHDDNGSCVKDEQEVPDNGQCYASEDECLMHVWSGYDGGYLSYLRQKHACMQEGNCWIGKSYVQYVSHCGGWYELRKEGIQNIHLTPEYFSTNPYIDPGEYNIWTPNGVSSVAFDIQTDHSGERYALYASYLNVDSHGQSIDGYATYGNFEFKPGYRYVLSPECVSNNETIYTAMVNCHNTVNGYAECTFTDNGYAFDRVYVKLQGNITNGNPDERYRTLTTIRNTEKFYMGVSGGTCWFGQVGGAEEDSNIDAYWRSSMIPSSSIYCKYKYKIGEYGRILRVY